MSNYISEFGVVGLDQISATGHLINGNIDDFGRMWKSSVWTRLIQDGVGVAELELTKTHLREILDSLGIIDAAKVAYYKTLLDSLSLTDEVKRGIAYYLTLVDNLSTTDSVKNTLKRSLADVLAVIDVQTKSAEYLRSVLDAVNTGDVLLRTTFCYLTLLDNLGFSDDVEKLIFHLLTDRIATTDQTNHLLSRLQTDSLGIDDTALEHEGNFFRTLTEVISILDALPQAEYRKALTDGIGAVDDVKRSFYKTLLDDLGVADPYREETGARFLIGSEEAKAEDIIKQATDFYRSLTEDVSTAEEVKSTLYRSLDEILTAIDSIRTTYHKKPHSAEHLFVEDILYRTIPRSLEDLMQLIDKVEYAWANSLIDAVGVGDKPFLTLRKGKADVIALTEQLALTLQRDVKVDATTILDGLTSIFNAMRSHVESLTIEDVLVWRCLNSNLVKDIVRVSDVCTRVALYEQFLHSAVVTYDRLFRSGSVEPPEELPIEPPESKGRILQITLFVDGRRIEEPVIKERTGCKLNIGLFVDGEKVS